MDLRLYEAARTGNTSSLRALLDEDPLILERGSLDSIAETCLHVAALAGSVDFVKEIMSFKPELAERINRDGFSPIHMASVNGYVDIVKDLLMSNKELSRQKSADGRTALHFAAITGRVDVLRTLINSCPECKADLTDQDETALHISLKNNQVEAFEMLLGKLKEINAEEVKRLVNAKDCDGNTILHIAVARKQFRVAKLLLDLEVEVNSENKSGYTALDMLFHSRRTVDDAMDHEIRKMLQKAGAHRSHQDIIEASTSTVATHQDDRQTNFDSYQDGENNATSHHLPENNLTPKMCNDCDLWMPWKFIVKEVSFVWKMWSTLSQEIENSKPEMQNALMVVAVLIATVTYQSVLSPPGGYRQFDSKEDPNPVHSSGIAIIASDAIMFLFVIFFSSIGFFVSVVIILMLTREFPLKLLLRVAVLAVSADFVCTIVYIAPIEFNVIYIVVMVMFVLVGIHLLYFMLWMLSRYKRAGRRQPEC
ncbi:ankyrin repeat-containing protein BDA1-like [Durio zibethinus]|uniref:Ankyrin repeat-containing protein BDA1-like n=1 Tax=Durio zibethinus TaxID=66656 RepID=A0A6P5ZNI1_DURZI|nr:ankyrin repeat-containing protein BDA1-like [Durio zibethinus]